MKRLIIALGYFGFASVAQAGNAGYDRMSFDQGGDLAGVISAASQLTPPDADKQLSDASSEVVVKEERGSAASVLPAWFNASKLAFVMLRKTGAGEFTAILRSGMFSTTEMAIFGESSGRVTVDFTEYASNPMAAPKNKAEVELVTAAARKEIVSILLEVQRRKPVQGEMLAVLNELVSFLGTPVGYKAAAPGAGGCAPGYERLLFCETDPRPGDNAIVSKMFDSIGVCAKGSKVMLELSAEGEVQRVPAAVEPRAGGVSYKVKEPKFNFIVNGGMAPGVPRRGTLQMFLGEEALESGFRCGK